MCDTIEEIFKKDKLNIKKYVTDFANLLKQETYKDNISSKVYSISAEFGIGKTFFCDLLKEFLELKNIPIIKLNIWETDFYNTPFIPIIIKLKELYKKYCNYNKFPNTKNLVNIVSGIKLELKVPFANLTIDGEKIINNYKKQIDIFNDYLKYEKELKNLKDFLRNWSEKESNPIVIIIDELDRCRPDYAVKTLETLKHFFDISGFVFILSIDEKQLKSSVKKLFGTDNFDGYKCKFINNSFILPKPNKEDFTNYLYEKTNLKSDIRKIEENKKDLIFKVKTDNLNEKVNLSDIIEFNQLQSCESIIKRYFASYSIWFKFTLRQMEQVFDRLKLFIKLISESNELFSPDLSVFLVCLHEFDIELFNNLKKFSFNLNYAIDYWGVLSHTERLFYKLYKKENKLDRNTIPVVPKIKLFSTDGDRINIEDNLDRFFIIENRPDYLKNQWITEIINYGKNANSIDNNARILIKICTHDEKYWKSLEDIDTSTSFDIEKFRNNYFERMDFLIKFS